MTHRNAYALGVRKMAVHQFAPAASRLDLARLGRHPDVMPADQRLGKEERIAMTTALLVETGEMAVPATRGEWPSPLVPRWMGRATARLLLRGPSRIGRGYVPVALPDHIISENDAVPCCFFAQMSHVAQRSWVAPRTAVAKG